MLETFNFMLGFFTGIVFLSLYNGCSIYTLKGKSKTLFYMRPLWYAIFKKKKWYTYFKLEYNKRGKLITHIYISS